MLGILALKVDIFLSDNIKVVLPSLTAVSHSTLICSILSFNEEQVQKYNLFLLIFSKKFFKLFNCEFVRTGLSSTKISSSVRLSKSSIFPRFPNLV